MKLDRLNEILKENGQKSVITFYSTNPRKVVINGNEFLDNSALRIIRRIEGDKIWMEFFDKIYLLDDLDAEKLAKSKISSKGGKSCQERHGDKIKENLNTGTPWNKNMKGDYPYSPWCKGLTKTIDARLMELSNNRKGKGNPMFGKTHSVETKERRSRLMKSLILSGNSPQILIIETHTGIAGIKTKSLDHRGRLYTIP